MSVTPVLNNPTLHYRPDPGEPAFLTNARASESAFVVMAQERRNLNRMKWEAFERGYEIVYADVSYAIRRVGSFWAVRAGHSEVLSRPADSRNAVRAVLAEQPGEGAEETDQPEGVSGTEEAEKNGQNQDTAEAAEAERLRDEAADLERELQALQAEAEAAETPEEVEAARQEAAQVEARLVEVERELAEIEAEELRRQTKQLQETVAGALQENQAVVGKLIGARYGGEPVGVGEALNLVV